MIGLITVILVLFLYWVLTLVRLVKVERRQNIIRSNWTQYVGYLKAKYPPKDGENFELACKYHQAIDEEIESWD